MQVMVFSGLRGGTGGLASLATVDRPGFEGKEGWSVRGSLDFGLQRALADIDFLCPLLPPRSKFPLRYRLPANRVCPISVRFQETGTSIFR